MHPKRLLQLWALLLFCFTAGADAEPVKVKVGVYLRNVDAIDFETNTYTLDFDLWMRWPDLLDPYPTDTFRFVNVADMWSVSVTPFYTDDAGKSVPHRLKDGSLYQRYHVEGTFYHKFWLGTYPLDWQKFTINLEDRLRDRNTLLWDPDIENSGRVPNLEIPGWAVRDMENEERVINPETDFGNTDHAAGAGISRYRFGVRFYRPARFFFTRLLPPLLMVFFTSVLIFLLPPHYVDSRLAVVSTGILSEIFLQLTYTSDLPSISISTIVDMLYNLAYFLLIVAFCVCVQTGRIMAAKENLEAELVLADPEKAKALQLQIETQHQRAVRLNRRAAYLLSGMMLAGIGIIVMWMRGIQDLSW